MEGGARVGGRGGSLGLVGAGGFLGEKIALGASSGSNTTESLLPLTGSFPPMHKYAPAIPQQATTTAPITMPMSIPPDEPEASEEKVSSSSSSSTGSEEQGQRRSSPGETAFASQMLEGESIFEHSPESKFCKKQKPSESLVGGAREQVEMSGVWQDCECLNWS